MTYIEFLKETLDTLPDVLFLCVAARDVALKYESSDEELKAQVNHHLAVFEEHIEDLLEEEGRICGCNPQTVLLLLLTERYGVSGVAGRKLLLLDMIKEAT